MTIMFPPDVHTGAALAPVTVERRFRVMARCSECRTPMIQDIEMVDEPHEPATVVDFYESGAVKRLNKLCERCGNEGITITQTFYLRGPTDV